MGNPGLNFKKEDKIQENPTQCQNNGIVKLSSGIQKQREK